MYSRPTPEDRSRLDEIDRPSAKTDPQRSVLQSLAAPTRAVTAAAALAIMGKTPPAEALVIPDDGAALFYSLMGESYAGPNKGISGGTVHVTYSHDKPGEPTKRVSGQASAVLLNRDHVMTVANIFDGVLTNNLEISIFVGTNYLTSTDQTFQVSRIFIHPEYAKSPSTTSSPNIAILRLQTKVPDCEERILPTNNITGEKYFTFSGFGPIEYAYGERRSADGDIKAGRGDPVALTNPTLSPKYYRAMEFQNIGFTDYARANEGDQGGSVWDNLDNLRGIVVGWDKTKTYFLDTTEPSIVHFLETIRNRREGATPPPITLTDLPSELQLSWERGSEDFRLLSSPSLQGPWSYNTSPAELTNGRIKVRVPTQATTNLFFRLLHVYDALPNSGPQERLPE
jgi:hypothetical protein